MSSNKTVIVLRSFVYSMKPQPGAKTAVSFRVPAGDFELTDEMLANPWIYRDFADGCIESPAQAAERARVAHAAAQKADAEADRSRIRAEQAFARATGGQRYTDMSQEELNKVLNTPVNELNRQAGDGIDKTVAEKEAAAKEAADKAAAEKEAAKVAAEKEAADKAAFDKAAAEETAKKNGEAAAEEAAKAKNGGKAK
jgi:hypothetical protein